MTHVASIKKRKKKKKKMNKINVLEEKIITERFIFIFVSIRSFFTYFIYILLNQRQEKYTSGIIVVYECSFFYSNFVMEMFPIDVGKDTSKDTV